MNVSKGQQIQITAKINEPDIDASGLMWHSDNNSVASVSPLPDNHLAACITGGSIGTCHIWAQVGDKKSSRLVIHVPDKSAMPIELSVAT